MIRPIHFKVGITEQVALSLAACLAALGGCALGPGKARMTLKNSTEQVILSATVIADDKTAAFSNIRPGETREATFRIWADSSYDIDVKLASGQELKTSDGYLTNGIESDDIVNVTRDAITVDLNYK
jgi:hypothetical protein